MSDCPCGSNVDYQACCGQYIENNETPPSPEALMRSRYTAYTLKNINYITATMKGKALQQFKEKSTTNWSDEVKWLGLKITSIKNTTHRLGYVTFQAQYSIQGDVQTLREKSEFHKMGSKWYYVNGRALKVRESD